MLLPSIQRVLQLCLMRERPRALGCCLVVEGWGSLSLHVDEEDTFADVLLTEQKILGINASGGSRA